MMQKPVKSRALHYTYLVSFFCFALVFILFGRALYQYRFKEKIQKNAPAFFETLPQKYFDRTVYTSRDAKKKRYFWLDRAMAQKDETGLAVRLFENPELFASVFPGYANAQNDPMLWEKYFMHNFDTIAWVPKLNPVQIPQLEVQGVYTSFQGCWDIYERHGADVILLGNSENYRFISPADLSAALGSAKVLSCTTSIGIVPEFIPELVNYVQKKHPLASTATKPKLVIWNYSAWYARHGSERNLVTLNKKEELISGSSFFNNDIGLAYFFPHLTWEDILPLNFYRIFYKESDFGKTNTFPFVNEKGKMEYMPVSSEEVGNEKKIEIKISERKLPVSYAYYEDMKPSDCDVSSAEKPLKDALTSLKRLARNVLIYIPPVIPAHYDSAPKCFVPAVKKLLNTIQDKNVKVLIASPEEIGLKASHFVFSLETPNAYRLDFNHTNYAGAKVFTSWLVRQLTPNYNKPLLSIKN